MRDAVGVSIRDARLFMVFNGRYKLIHGEGGVPPMLFDLETDPEEFHDLCKAGTHQEEVDRLYGHLAAWGRRMSQRVTQSDAQLEAARGKSMRKGILAFMKDGSEVDEELTQAYRGPVSQNHLKN